MANLYIIFSADFLHSYHKYSLMIPANFGFYFESGWSPTEKNYFAFSKSLNAPIASPCAHGSLTRGYFQLYNIPHELNYLSLTTIRIYLRKSVIYICGFQKPLVDDTRSLLWRTAQVVSLHIHAGHCSSCSSLKGIYITSAATFYGCDNNGICLVFSKLTIDYLTQIPRVWVNIRTHSVISIKFFRIRVILIA